MSVRRATQLVVTLPMTDGSTTGTMATGITFASGDVKVSKDGGTFANVTNLPTEIGSTGVYALTLTAAEMNASWVHVLVNKTGYPPLNVQLGTDGSNAGTVQTDGGNTSQTFKTDRTEATNDFWKDTLLLFTTGALAGQVKKVSAYNGTSKFVTLQSAFTGTPSNGDRFILINL